MERLARDVSLLTLARVVFTLASCAISVWLLFLLPLWGLQLIVGQLVIRKIIGTLWS